MLSGMCETSPSVLQICSKLQSCREAPGGRHAPGRQRAKVVDGHLLGILLIGDVVAVDGNGIASRWRQPFGAQSQEGVAVGGALRSVDVVDSGVMVNEAGTGHGTAGLI